MVMGTIDLMPAFLIHCKPRGASRVPENQISFGVEALNINQALLQNPEVLRGESSFSLDFSPQYF